MSQGEIEGICTEVAAYLRPLYESYLQELQEGEAANMDETGMRIDGENQWLWAGATKDPERETVLFHHDERRSSAVAKELLGEEFAGVVGCDFYSAYNPVGGRKQRCWAHLLGDTSELKEGGEEGEGRYSWAGARKHEILMSVLATCRARGKDFQELITGMLREAVASAN